MVWVLAKKRLVQSISFCFFFYCFSFKTECKHAKKNRFSRPVTIVTFEIGSMAGHVVPLISLGLEQNVSFNHCLFFSP